MAAKQLKIQHAGISQLKEYYRNSRPHPVPGCSDHFSQFFRQEGNAGGPVIAQKAEVTFA
jgi:hypothetical protein